ncbi:MAG TPA: LptA/OstA family protein [Microvirga sp.]|jgi:lipopolysaccharide export system protein LptA|nr:LptA/OstA family protein [Microvirga sp.]
MTPFRAALAALALVTPAAALAQQGAAPRDRASAFGSLGSNREPIKIDADRLDVFDRESRAVFAGNVVVVQGETTMKCTALSVSYEPRGGLGVPAAAPAAMPGDGAIRKIECKGPVTIASRTQVATGDSAVFDRVANRVLLSGNAVLSDGPNVTRGERVVYDLRTGVANVETAPGGRVRAMFLPGGGDSGPAQPKPADAKPKPPAAR